MHKKINPDGKEKFIGALIILIGAIMIVSSL